MNYDVLIAFTIFQAVFFLLDLYIFTKVNRDIARKWENNFFCALILVHAVYLILNSTWTLQEYGVLHLGRTWMTLLCMCSLSCVCLCAFVFFRFTMEKIRFRPMQNKVVRLLSLLPELLSLALILLTPWTHWAFSLDEENTLVHGPAYLVMLLSSSLYLLAVAVIAGYYVAKSRATAQRRANSALLASVLIIILFIVLDGHLPTASILPVAIFAVIVVIFITMQESNINSDALTGMNNRRKAEEYLTSKLYTVSEEYPLFLYMCDLNGFKSINDVYGHAEGDEALLLAANVLKQCAARCNGFTSRFGGDEFLISWQPGRDDSANPEELIKEVGRLLREQAEAAKKPYSLSVSIGYARCSDRGEPLISCIKRADEMLYYRKQAFHRENDL